MTKKMLVAAGLLAITGMTIAGCYNDNVEELYPAPSGGNCDTTNVTYTGTLKAIVDNQCATGGCHLGVAPSGYDLSTYNGLKGVAVSGKLMASLNHTGPSPMPKGMAKLDNCTLAKFQAWVNNNQPQ